MARYYVRRRQHYGWVRGLLLLMIAAVTVIIYQCVQHQRNKAQNTQSAATSAPMEVEKLPEGIDITRPVTVRVYDHESGTTVTMDLEDYICHVVAAEMPASYEPEALKAQAVAIRTLAVTALLEGGRSCTSGSDLCTSSEHCQAYLSDTACHDRWGDEYDLWWGKIEDAVSGTDGQIMTYQGQPIIVYYHSTSGGQTEDAVNVFSVDEPYLRSVESAGEESTSHYEQTLTFTRKEIVSKLSALASGTGLKTGQLEDQLKVLSRFASGRVNQIQVGKITMTGKQLRAALELPSTQFTISFSGDSVLFDCLGYGHGVGMSQAGANAMAQDGAGYQEILTHYYTGVDIVKY